MSLHSLAHLLPLGLQEDAGKFFTFLLLLLLINMAALSLAFCISALTGNFTVANALITVVFVVSIVRTDDTLQMCWKNHTNCYRIIAIWWGTHNT